MEKITFSESFANFCKENSEKSALCGIINDYINSNHPSLMLMFTAEEVNYITFRKDATISYLPAGKEHKVNAEGEWEREGRQNGKPAKVIRKLLTDKGVKLFKDSDFEQFANLYKKTYSTNDFEIKIHEDIEYIYNNCSTGIDSCMNGKGNYFGMLHGICKIAALHDDSGNIVGRALLWPYKDPFFMDRIYSVKDHLKELFIDFCAQNRFFRKKFYSTRDHKTTWIDPDGNEIEIQTKINCDADAYKYPYLDTFHWGNDSCLYNYPNQKHIYTYDCVDGTRTGGDTYVCDNCGDDVHEDDLCGNYCSDCCEYDDYADEYILADDAVELINGKWTHKDNATEIKNRGYVHDSGLEAGSYYMVDGDWYDIDDLIYCEYNNEYFPADDVEYIDDLEMNVHIDSINDAYEDAGWVIASDGNWIIGEDEEEEVEDED